MTYWSGEKIASNLKSLFMPNDPGKIDCSAYRLSLGREVFVTTDQRFDDSPEKGLKLYLDPGEQCRIPPGQFAFLLTEEVVTVPDNAMAFISIRAQYKFKGLVNVSGFHVDPGWKGCLIFAVYNAGPSPVVLSRGAEMFLIWYADLDRTSTSIKRIKNPQLSIPDELTEGMSGQVFSPIALSKDVIELKEKAVELRDDFSDRHSSLLVEVAQLKTDYTFYKKLLIGAFIAVIGLVIRELYLSYTQRYDPQKGVVTEKITAGRDPSGVGTLKEEIPHAVPGTADAAGHSTNSKNEIRKATPPATTKPPQSKQAAGPPKQDPVTRKEEKVLEKGK